MVESTGPAWRWSNEYIKAGKKEHPDIHMKVYNEMNLDDKEFKILGAKI